VPHARARWAAVLALLAVPTLATATDRSQMTLVSPVALSGSAAPALLGSGGTAWVDGSSKGRFKLDDHCRVLVRAAKLAAANTDGQPGTGDEIICIADSLVTSSGPTFAQTSVVLRGEVRDGKMRVKENLLAEGTGCVPAGGGAPRQVYDTRFTCWEADPAYFDAAPPPVPFASDPTQGVFPSSFAPRPSSPILATSGLNFAP
jgi:hypothetical protein